MERGIREETEEVKSLALWEKSSLLINAPKKKFDFGGVLFILYFYIKQKGESLWEPSWI
jgi:hypothetical protein